MKIETNIFFKYGYTKLDSASEEFKFLRKYFDTTSKVQENYEQLYYFSMYKVNERDHEKVTGRSNNLMLFHGTNEKGATGILKEGFLNSERGTLGKGVYMTNCSSTACFYSIQRIRRGTDEHYIFVNEVLESEKLQTFQFSTKVMQHFNTKPKNQFEKHIYDSCSQPTEKDYIVDQLGRRYVNAVEIHPMDQYIAEASIVKPRYLIVLERK